ncbi:MAG: RNA methyltransferase [Actinomycetota bacterium]|nr:RNA methyltransferase [Actinomycetota bacterium]
MITSLRNPRIAGVRRLRRTRERKVKGRTPVEGPFLLEEAIRAGVIIHEVYAAPDDATTAATCERIGIEQTLVSNEVLASLASSVSPRGPVAVVSVPASAAIRPMDSIVMWDVSDPGNAGTIIRSAAAFGFQVIATAGCVDLWSPKVVRAGVGGHFRTPLVDTTELSPQVLMGAGLRAFVAAAGSSTSPTEMVETVGPVAIIVGNEAHGVPEAVREGSGAVPISLTMPGGTESLNVGVAASILMYLRTGE